MSGPTVAGEGEVKVLGRLARPRHPNAVTPEDTHSEWLGVGATLNGEGEGWEHGMGRGVVCTHNGCHRGQVEGLQIPSTTHSWFQGACGCTCWASQFTSNRQYHMFVAACMHVQLLTPLAATYADDDSAAVVLFLPASDCW